MIVVKVGIWPGGESDRAFEISRVGIANVSRGGPVSNYELTALMARDGHEYVVRGEIDSHERDLGWVPLVKRAMGSLLLAERLTHAIPYDDPVAELLRRGERAGRACT